MTHHARSIRRPAFSMAEAVMCIAIVGVLLVAALNSVAFARTMEYRISTRDRAWLLARELMAEISAQPYADPTTGTATFGLESGESGSGSRALWDDFDDYQGLQESPPRAKDGTAMTDLTGWSRAVRINRVAGISALSMTGTETGLKSCFVTVSRNGVVLATLATVRSASWSLETP